ncbi:FAD binding domain-containing protein [Micromonospora sp. NBC_01796]|uniref:FAD binding domain-containing protein n=1 Tax=Micromonospora sp. NBC_01796 TaxID=2975987 RepID=UPI002DDB68B7|nr:FAD binding domain-containing protein [Micromonospora sp. NBC_01796]WSA83698.1 FAD binding domain-containing protein [Micromonospora sp. NBC_01796]
MYTRVDTAEQAVARAAAVDGALGPTNSPIQFLAGGTNIVDYLKLSCWTADELVDINGLRDVHGSVEVTAEGIRFGSLVRLHQAADHPVVGRDYPVIAETLQRAASQQIRNMATLGGNLLQRTRCSYFRDVDYDECNKRRPGSGCAAIGGKNRMHAVLGVSDRCIASYPGDLAQALVALDTRVETLGRDGVRTFPLRDLHTGADRPEVETILAPGELITALFVPSGPHTRRSTYLKVRDRESYEFAIASAAVALDLAGDGTVTDVRIAPGGLAYRPWRADAAEAFLRGRALTTDNAAQTGRVALAGAVTHGDNNHSPELGARTVARALMQAAEM